MISVPVTYAKLRSVLAVYALGLSTGSTLDAIKRSNKCLRHVRDAAIDFEEALKMKGKELQSVKEQAGEDEEKLKAWKEQSAKFAEDVEKSQKESISLECTKEQIESLKEVLGKIDWTSSESKESLKGEKFNQFDMINVDEFIEDVETVLKGAE